MANKQVNNPDINEKIISFFAGRNEMEVQAKIQPPIHVPGGGYWLNNVEVDINQLVQAYKDNAVTSAIIMRHRH